jgi:hypothetical protein
MSVALSRGTHHVFTDLCASFTEKKDTLILHMMDTTRHLEYGRGEPSN